MSYVCRLPQCVCRGYGDWLHCVSYSEATPVSGGPSRCGSDHLGEDRVSVHTKCDRECMHVVRMCVGEWLSLCSLGHSVTACM